MFYEVGVVCDGELAAHRFRRHASGAASLPSTLPDPLGRQRC